MKDKNKFLNFTNIIILAVALVLFGISYSIAYSLGDNGEGLNKIISEFNQGKGNSVGNTVWLKNIDLKERKDLYCVHHKAPVGPDNVQYTIANYVKINGFEGINKDGTKVSHKSNAMLAYILNKGEGYGGQGDWENFTDTQKAVYGFIAQWDNDVKLLGDTFRVNYEENEGITHEETIKAAESYADNLSVSNSETAYAKDRTNKDAISVTADGNYVIVGPFNWEFSGGMEHIAVMDDEGKELENDYVGYIYYEGNEEKDYVNFRNIKSCNDFYIKLNINKINENETKLTKISKIKGTIEQNVSSQDVYNVDIWFLKPGDGKQELILVKPEEVKGTTKPVKSDFSFDYDIPITRSLAIEKIDANKQEVKLDGVGFLIKNESTGKFLRKSQGKITYVDYDYKDYDTYKNDTSKNKPSEFYTENGGKIKIEGLVVGDYVAYETKNPNYGYKQISGKIKIKKTGSTIVPNEQEYIKLSGYVWKDIQSSKTTVRNDLYKTNYHSEVKNYVDNEDTAFNGITVRLKDKRDDKKVLGETTTKERGLYDEIDGGEYIFKNVLIKDLSNYYVEFEYDGLIWQSVGLNLKKDTGSKSTDKEERAILDKNFASINSTGENIVNVKDKNSNNKYSIKYNKTKDYTTSIKDSSDCTLHANTKDAEYDISKLVTTDTTEIRNINLGLYERPQADLSLTQDLENVNVGVNGYWHVYKYASRTLTDGGYQENDPSTWNVGVKFKNSYTGTYNRAIYKSDLDYQTEDNNKELQVYLTYTIALTNESSYTTKVNSIIDYFDSRYTLKAVGTGLDEQNNVTGNVKYQASEKYNNNYQKCIIDVDTTVKSGESNYIYVQFLLNKDAVLGIMNNKEVVSNRAEINSYTVLKNNGNTVAAVDRDSVPGNTKIENIDTYEDDTDSAPAIQLELAGARKITGTVFVDGTSNELLTGKIRQGSGTFEDGETTIDGVTVTLHELNNSIQDMTVETKDGGNFEFSGYIPGQYTITYTWGDKTYIVQEYKGTVYDSSRKQDNMYWYKDDVDTRKTDAIDNYQTRCKIDEEMAAITDNTLNDKIIDAYNGGNNHQGIDTLKMDSTTPTMEFGVEYDTTVTDGTKDKVEFIVKNVDFGIVERARQQLDMTKRVSSFKITLANGQVLVDATINEKGELQGIHDYVTYMAPSSNNGYSNNGYIKAEMDNELIQGATAEIGYEIKFINNSEVDYMSENYYKYGKEEGSKVTLTPLAVVDYLDKKLGFDASLNSDWKQITTEDLKSLNAIPVKDENNIDSEFLNSRIILYTEKTATPIEPTQNTSVNLKVSKLLTSSGDLSFDNDAETVKIEKTSSSSHRGSIIKYFPTDKSETVMITPSTGDNRNYILPIAVGVIALVTLGVGVFAIKKFVIK